MSWSELDEDAVDRVAVIACKLVPQFSEKRSLLLVEALSTVGLMVVVIPLHYSDPTAEPTAYSFNRVRTHEYRNISADCPLRDVKFVRQIAVCIVPSQAQ